MHYRTHKQLCQLQSRYPPSYHLCESWTLPRFEKRSKISLSLFFFSPPQTGAFFESQIQTKKALLQFQVCNDKRKAKTKLVFSSKPSYDNKIFLIEGESLFFLFSFLFFCSILLCSLFQTLKMGCHEFLIFNLPKSHKKDKNTTNQKSLPVHSLAFEKFEF